NSANSASAGTVSRDSIITRYTATLAMISVFTARVNGGKPNVVAGPPRAIILLGSAALKLSLCQLQHYPPDRCLRREFLVRRTSLLPEPALHPTGASAAPP